MRKFFAGNAIVYKSEKVKLDLCEGVWSICVRGGSDDKASFDSSAGASSPPRSFSDLPFANAVEAIYQTATSPDDWPHALSKIADCFGDVGTVLLWRRDDGSFGTIVSPSLADAQRDYEARWWREDIRAFRATERGYLLADAYTDALLVTEEEIATHPIYTQFLAPHELGWFAGIGISPDPRVVVAISVQRKLAKPRFTDDDLALLTRLGRHAENALRLGIRLVEAEMVSHGLGDALSRLRVGVFVLDERRRVLFANAAGERFVGKGALQIVRERLSVFCKAGDDALEGALAALAGARAEDLHAAPRPILIARPGEARPLTLYVLPVRSSLDFTTHQFLTQARTIVLVIDAEVDEPPDATLVCDLLGLTLAEARVAALVAFGQPPGQAAERLGIAEETARTTLKRVFTKVGVSRQSELALMLSKLVLR